MNFARILESRLRQEILKDLPSSEEIRETRASRAPQIPSEIGAQLLGKISPQRFSTAQQARIYHRFKPVPQPRPAHVLSSAQAQAYQFFRSSGSELANNFTKKDLKSAFRKLALRLHPDQGGQAEGFCTLRKAFECLQTVFP